MDLDYFAAALAERLAAVVPTGITITAADGMLWYTAAEGQFLGQFGDGDVGRSGSYVHDNFGLHGDSEEANVIGLAVQILDELQDYISEATHLPWPGTVRQPQPHGRIEDAQLLLWYADGDEVKLTIAPLPLTGPIVER